MVVDAQATVCMIPGRSAADERYTSRMPVAWTAEEITGRQGLELWVRVLEFGACNERRRIQLDERALWPDDDEAVDFGATWCYG